MKSWNSQDQGREESLDSTCNFVFFECVLPRRDMDKRKSSLPRMGVEREMPVMDQQPHLVAPMKLTVFDMLPPPTPPASGPPVFQWVTQTRNLASRASSRASKKSFGRPTISDPQPAINPRNPPARRPEFRPLELSIYMPRNRLSDLPTFDGFKFTDLGEIQFPPKALLRTTSEQFLPTPSAIEPAAPKAASMIERRTPHMGRLTHTSTSSMYSARSEFDALGSHPVSWSSPLGKPPQMSMAAESKPAVTVLDSMKEEPTPLTSRISLSRKSLADHPAVDPSKEASWKPSILEDPSPMVARKSMEADQSQAVKHSHASYQSRKLVSHWLGHRANMSSTSTTRSMSFAEHRHKRAQFYKLSSSYAEAPKPFRLPFRQESQHHHQRSMTVSTAQTSDLTDGRSLFDDDDMESMTTAPTASEIQSRTGTIRSVSTAAGVKQPMLPVIVSGIAEVAGYVGRYDGDDGDDGDDDASELKQLDNSVVVKEINGPLRGPIGIAF